ncbi:tyrosine-type recombinase/integrase [Aquabacterium soli]|nr:tyrosine-type recombinase/integrase [Aquabacterium soli]
MSSSTEGTWVARCRVETTGKHTWGTLGDFADLRPSLRYDAALDAAEAWFKRAGMGLTEEVKTVKDACEAYISHLRTSDGGQETRERKADEARARLNRWVYAHPIAKLQLSKLSMGAVEKWRKETAAEPVTINPHASAEKQRQRPRSPSTLNRDMATLRAALNFAHTRGHVASDVAWLGALKPIKGADKARNIYLSKDQRRTLLSKAAADLRNFIEGMCRLPLRPGALAALTVANFDKRLGVLTVGKDKSGADRKLTLPKETAAFLKNLCAGKLPAAPVFARADGKAWNKDAWKKPFKAAALLAEIPETATAYSLRHSTITDLCMTLDLLTVAHLSGTSTEMIDRHYGHLQKDRASEALAMLAL